MSRLGNLIRRPIDGLAKMWNPTEVGAVNTAWPVDFWQRNYKPRTLGEVGTVEACVAAYSQTVAQLPIEHLRDRPDGGKDIVTTSPAARLFRRPNEFQSRSDFLLALVRSLLIEGNAFVYIDDVAEPGNPSAMYILHPRFTRAHRLPDTGEIFFAAGRSKWFNWESLDEAEILIPARRIVHIKWETDDDPLHGLSPIRHATTAISANAAIMGHEANFFTNMARPSGVLTTDQELKKEQMAQLREAFAAKSQAINSGEVPILANGLKWEPLSISSNDAQVVEAFRMTVREIARVFRVPLPLIGEMEGSTFNNAETLLNFWLSSGLGFMLDHIELAFDHAFRLPAGQHLNFNTHVLLRTDLKTRIAALGDAVQKGIYSPNEARRIEGLPSAKDGDEPRVQQQVVPLSAWSQSMQGNPTPPAPDPAEPAAPDPDDDDGDDDDETRAALASDILIASFTKAGGRYDA